MAQEEQQGIVIYRLPREKQFYYMEGNVIQAESLRMDQHGFVLAPFKSGHTDKLTLLQPNVHKVISARKIKTLKFHHARKSLNSFCDYHTYLERVKKVKSMFSTDFSKVVLSRRSKVSYMKLSNACDMFLKLEKAYPNSFIYVFSSEATGTWGGASPELFISHSQGELKTMALAGTIQLQNTTEQEICWTDKEKEEHHIVEQFIEHVLQNNCKTFHKAGPFTQITGRLAHLLTKYSAQIDAQNLPELIQQLHPTPAVCGLPKETSYQTIQEIESYDRSYYTGFLGLWNMDSSIHLFVNLRCMQFFENHAVIYAGGGITSSSDPEKEWQETENKMRSITNLLE